MEENAIKQEYEIAYLSREEGALGGVVSLIKSHQGEPQSEGVVRRIALSYPIKKETQAFFGALRFMMEPDRAKALEHDLRTHAGVLRALVIRVKEKIEKPRSPRAPHPGISATPRPQSPPPERKAPAPAAALSNEALEKKIEEMLR